MSQTTIDPLGTQPLKTTYLYEYGQLTDSNVYKTDTEILKTTYQYDPDYLYQSRMINPLGQTTTYQYDFATGDKISEIDNFGTKTEFSYIGFGLVNQQKVTYKDVDNNTHIETTSYDYDKLGNQLKVTLPNNVITDYSYDEENRQISTSTSVTVRDFGDELGLNVTEPTEPITIQTYNFYDIAGRLVGSRDGEGKDTFYTVDWAGRVLETQIPLKHKTVQVYDSNGNVENSTEYTYYQGVYKPQGTVYNKYDELNRLIAESDAIPEGQPLNYKTKYFYDVFGKQVKIVDAEDNETYQEYNKQNLLTHIWDDSASNAETWYEYDSLGNQELEKKITGVENGVTTYAYTYFEYDKLNRLKKTIDPKNVPTTYTYSVTDNKKTTQEPEGATIEEYYDGMGRLGKEIKNFPQNDIYKVKTTTTLYDEAGSVKTEKIDDNGKREETSYTYDEIGRKITETSIKDNGTTNITEKKYKYDSNDNIVAIWVKDQPQNRDAFYNKISYEYDATNRMTKETSKIPSKPASETKYTFEDNLRQRVVENPAGTTTIAYDEEGKIKTAETPEGTFSYDYYDNNLVKELIQVGGKVAFQYDNDKLNDIKVLTLVHHQLLTFIILMILMVRLPRWMKKIRMAL
ncbi:MAG: hypothetical protein K0S80_1960 [Neobacillus sp.]|nr:hypothetical protein [Neobacillus sp.]